MANSTNKARLGVFTCLGKISTFPESKAGTWSGQGISIHSNEAILYAGTFKVSKKSTADSSKGELKQIKPFNTNFHLSERVEQLVKEGTKWKITTNKKKVFIVTPQLN